MHKHNVLWYETHTMRALVPMLLALLATTAALHFPPWRPGLAPNRSPQHYQFASRPQRHPQHRRLDVWEERVLPPLRNATHTP